MESIRLQNMKKNLLDFKNYDLFYRWKFDDNIGIADLNKYNSARFVMNKIISEFVVDSDLSDSLLYEINYELYQLKITLMRSDDIECANKVYSFYRKYWVYSGINEYFAKTRILLIADCLISK
jgi:hypothetical protein